MRRIFIDPDKCEGCMNCAIGCMQSRWVGGVYDLNLAAPSSEPRNGILTDRQRRYRPLFCRHCERPACAKSCMSGALAKDGLTGSVGYDRERCARCYMCVVNCPFGVLRPERASGDVAKCDFCAIRGGEPACVESCPTESICVKEVAG